MATSTFTRLADITQDQWGLVTRRQAEAAGVSPRTMGRLVAEESILERVAQGVYRLAGAPVPDHMGLRAAWLQLAPEKRTWERIAAEGVVSHRSAADLCDLGHLPADRHEFTFPTRRQSRRADVRFHTRPMRPVEMITRRGLATTRPSRTASDLLWDMEDPQAVAQLVADALRAGYDHSGPFVDALEPHAGRFGLRRGDGLGLFRWLMDLVADRETSAWMDEARAHHERRSGAETRPAITPLAPVAWHGVL